MKNRGIIFDLDGVICSTDHYHYLAWKKLADKLGIYFDETINNRLRGVSRMASLEIILERCDRTLTEEEKQRLIEAEWERSSLTEDDKYTADIKIFANDRTGLLVDVSRMLTDGGILIRSMNTWTSRQGLVTMETSFDVGSIVELRAIIDKLRMIAGVIDVERATA